MCGNEPDALLHQKSIGSDTRRWVSQKQGVGLWLVAVIFGSLDPRRFEALAGFARQPEIALITEELAWYANSDERVLGIVLVDLIDNDYSWVVFGRDELQRYRAIDVSTSHATIDEARSTLFRAMEASVNSPDAFFHQGDASGEPVDFFAPAIPEEKFHPTFKILSTEKRYSPAREILQAMMRYHQDVDGHFVQNFQANGFDARLWELYLWATFTELGYVRKRLSQIPDFVFRGVRGDLALEAVSANPPDHGKVPNPTSKVEFVDYLENYIPIKLAGALKSKLNHKPPYWEEPGVASMPFCIAVQDYSSSGSMRFIVPAAVEYVFGVRHWMENGVRKIAPINVHRCGKQRAQSGFFRLPGSENVSAVIVNPQGTITKFNRLGFVAGFGNPNVRMVRSGVQRNDGNPGAPGPTHFAQHVDASYEESWVEGMVVLHNPNARISLNPGLIPGAAHEFLQEDGSIRTLLPEFHPLFSQTMIVMPEDTDSEATTGADSQ